MASGDLFSRDQALEGLPARRAGTLLFLIESRWDTWPISPAALLMSPSQMKR
jgi:hypothetical protein